MNPLHWQDALWRQQRNMDPNYQRPVRSRVEDCSRTDNHWDTSSEHASYTFSEPHSSTGVNVWERLGPPPSNFNSDQSKHENPDGESLEMDTEDPELTRKRKQLKEIEERIQSKRVSLALKKVEPFAKKTAPGVFHNEEPGESLRDRVNGILQQRHSLNFFYNVQSPKERVRSTSLRKEDHPLKLRVKTLMKQRCRTPNTGAPDVTPHLHSQSISSLAEEETSADKGFQRFLSVLNSGVDMDFLSRIVNAESEDLPLGDGLMSIQPSAGESKQSNSSSSLPGPSQSSRYWDERLDMSGDGEKNDRGGGSFGCRSRPKSPPAVKKKKEEEEKAKVDEQRQQLQNILKTLGLDLEVDEMSKVADRTQERLYGKKLEDPPDSRAEQESRQGASHRRNRSSSSSSYSSSCSSSRSTSRSFSPISSHSRDTQERRSSERSHSRDGGRERLKCRDGSQDTREAQSIRASDKHEAESQKIVTYQPPQVQTYSYPYPNAFSSFPDYTLSQYSQCSGYHSGTYSTTTNSYWTHTPDAIPSSLYPGSSFSQFPSSTIKPPSMSYPYYNKSEDMNFFLNPDLSASEGQTGSASGRRCLQVISTLTPGRQSCLKQLTKAVKKGSAYRRQRKMNGRKRKRIRKRMLANQNKKLQSIAVSQGGVLQKVGASQNVKASQDDQAEQVAEIKKPPTEDEIKANLRKTLEAFNQKAKEKGAQPAKQTPN